MVLIEYRDRSLMSYSPIAIANFFIELAIQDKNPVTPMKVQKLVYFAHGWHLALTDKGDPLLSEQVEAWEFGPVVRSLYHALKHFANQPIKEKISNFSAFGETEISEASDVSKLLKRIWGAYGKYSATRLSNATHVVDGPWHIAYFDKGGQHRKNTDISDKLITDYFKSKMKSAE